jgi:hypothetical protein
MDLRTDAAFVTPLSGQPLLYYDPVKCFDLQYAREQSGLKISVGPCRPTVSFIHHATP